MAEKEEKVPFIKSRASVTLDAIRGIAAVLVTLEHLRYRLFIDFNEASRHNWPLRALFFLSQLGHSAVIVFFVLSGFLVGGSLLRAYRNDMWSWRIYLTHRFVRLWIVLIPALLIGLAWDSLSIHVAHGQLNPPFVEARVAQTAAAQTVRGFLGNVVFLQDVAVPVFGSNGPLWSLTNEFWYYILFPLGFFAVVSRYNRGLRVLFVCTLILICVVLNLSVLWYAPIWLLGVLLFFLPRLTLTRIVRTLLLVFYLCIVAVLLKLSFHFPLLADYLLGLGTCAITWVVLSARSAADATALPTRTFRLLASFSYTLYLVHVPIFTFAGICLVRGQLWQPTPGHLLCAFAIWFGTLLFALVVASITEFRTDRVRRWVESWQGRYAALREFRAQ